MIEALGEQGKRVLCNGHVISQGNESVDYNPHIPSYFARDTVKNI